MTHSATATPTKLSDGTWGARIQTRRNRIEIGDTIHIETSGGKRWDARVARIVRTDGDTAIVATESMGRGGSRRPRGFSSYGSGRRNGWDGRVGSSSYYTSGQYDIDS